MRTSAATVAPAPEPPSTAGRVHCGVSTMRPIQPSASIVSPARSRCGPTAVTSERAAAPERFDIALAEFVLAVRVALAADVLERIRRRHAAQPAAGLPIDA